MMLDLIGQELGGFKVLSKIGEGGMGAVFKAEQPLLGRLVALKVVAPDLTKDSNYIARFRHEAIAAASFNHVNLVQVYTAGESAGYYYIAAELVEGETVQDRITRTGRLTPRESLAICYYTAEALKYAWQKAKVIHRDIKPANIFLSLEGEVKLGDMGLAKRVGAQGDAALTQSGFAMGTPHYMSPEQARGEKDIDFRADIYSLGCTLYHMLSGQMPYESASDPVTVMLKQVHDPPPAILNLAPKCPMPLVMMLNKMLAKHPTARYQSYEELIAELMQVRERVKQAEAGVSVPAPASAPPLTPPGTPWKRKPVARLIATAAVAVIAVAAIGVWLGAPGQTKRDEPKPAPPPIAKAVPKPQPVVEEPAPMPEPAPLPKPPPEPEPFVPGPGWLDALIEEVTALAPEDQVRRVMMELKNLNPRFAGTETHRIEDGEVAELQFSTEHAADISPVRALARLQRLYVSGGEEGGKLADLSPLKGLKLHKLVCAFSQVADLSPLAGMPLESLDCHASAVRDLTPLKDLPLKELTFDFKKGRDASALVAIRTLEKVNGQPLAEFAAAQGIHLPTPEQMIAATLDAPVDDAFIKAIGAMPPELRMGRVLRKLRALNPDFKSALRPRVESNGVVELTLPGSEIKDLSPLRALPALQSLSCNGTAGKSLLADLAPLRGLELTRLSCATTQVSDLSPLSKMPLTALNINDTAVASLAPLKGTLLAELRCRNTRITDLSPLRDLPLKELECDIQPDRDREALWAIKTLETINGQPAAGFWNTIGPPDEPWMKALAAMPAEQQVAAVMTRLKELNPGFDGRETHKVESNIVTDLSFSTVAVKDITPLKALRGLKRLSLAPWGAATARGALAELAPLRRLALTSLWLHNTQVADLAPLKGMPLSVLSCDGTAVSDLTPLRGAPLTVFSCGNTAVNELGSLDAAPLTVLWCNGTRIADFAPLIGKPLKEIRCDFVPERDGPALRGITTLAQVNGMPATAFWMRYDVERAGGRPMNPLAGGAAQASPEMVLPPQEQLRRITAKFKDANPAFQGELEPVIEKGKIIGLTFPVASVTDLSALKGLTTLRSLKLVPPARGGVGALADLSPLKGLPLTNLYFNSCPISDLSPLAGMPLTTLYCTECRIKDLSPLKDAKLTSLNCNFNRDIADLSPLAGMPLTRLFCNYTAVSDLTPLKGMKLALLQCINSPVGDLSPLAGMPLEELSCSGTRVSDLGPLRDMLLQELNCAGTQVKDLSPLKGQKLRYLMCANTEVADLAPLAGMPLFFLSVMQTPVSDLSPLRAMPLTTLYARKTAVSDFAVLKTLPLQVLTCDFVPERDANILRSVKTLTRINDLPAAEFWRRQAP